MDYKTKRLLLRTHKDHGRPKDIKVIIKHLQEYAPKLKVHLVDEDLNFFERIRYRGSSVVSFLPWYKKRPFKAKLFAGEAMTKEKECARLDAHGIPVPSWHVWKKGEPKPDLTEWGPYIVRKPNRGARGAEVKIVKTSRIKWKMVKVDYANIVTEPFFQEFIYTGKTPKSYRVATLFGTPIYSLAIQASEEDSALEERFGFRPSDNSKTTSIVANRKSSTYRLCHDQEVLDLASRAHAAFPEIPLLGIDIIRDADTGKLWVLEVNASGYVWHFTSPIGKSVQETHNIDLLSQFGGFSKVAEILAQKFQSHVS